MTPRSRARSGNSSTRARPDAEFGRRLPPLQGPRSIPSGSGRPSQGPIPRQVRLRAVVGHPAGRARLSLASAGGLSARPERQTKRATPCSLRDLYINAALTTLLGSAPEDLIGAPLSQIIPDRLRASHLEGFDR